MATSKKKTTAPKKQPAQELTGMDLLKANAEKLGIEITHLVHKDDLIDLNTPDGIPVDRTILIALDDINLSVGQVYSKEDERTKQVVFNTNLTDFTGSEKKDIPKGTTMVLLNCNLNWPKIPVAFSYPSLGTYNGRIPAWVDAKDVAIIYGNTGIKIA